MIQEWSKGRTSVDDFMTSSFKVLFYLKRNAPKKNGLIPVMCRITVNGKMCQFSCKLDVEEKMWSVELGRLAGRSQAAVEGNRALDKIRVGINKAYQEVVDNDSYVTAEKVRNAYLGMGMNHKTLLAVFRQHNEDYLKQVGKMKSERSYLKYGIVYKHLEEFIRQRYKVSDIALKELAPAFITDFEIFLRTEKASDILSIPQIAVPDLANIQNDLHIGQGTDISKRLQKARWTDETRATKVFPANVDALMGAFVSAHAAEDQVYVQTQGSDLTKRRLEKDAQRDVLYKEIRKTVDTFATLSIFPEKQQKALVMQPIMQKYNIQPDGGIEAQTVATDQWLQEQLRNYQCELAARELGIFDSINQLKTLNDEIQRLTADRNDERAQKTTAELKNARQATDQAFRALALMLNAQAITAADNYLYTELIKSIQETIKYYRQIADDRRRTSRRVSVKSPVVGNKLYAVSAGWTWQRLIDDGKALLAVEPASSASSADDAPARAVSTDKKALKAGGLTLALGGTPVKPTDDVDAEKEYELIPIE